MFSMMDIQRILAPNEKILWQGKPQFFPFIFSSLPIFVFGLIFALIPAAGMGFSSAALLVPHVWIGLILGPGVLLYSILVHRHIQYVITDKRTLIQKGLIGRDYVGIEHDQVTSTRVNVGLGDKLFGDNSGTVLITHAGGQVSKKGSPRPEGLVSITDPYAVYSMLNQTSHDVRTDIQYPNALRPSENKGYKTEYKQ